MKTIFGLWKSTSPYIEIKFDVKLRNQGCANDKTSSNVLHWHHKVLLPHVNPPSNQTFLSWCKNCLQNSPKTMNKPCTYIQWLMGISLSLPWCKKLKRKGRTMVSWGRRERKKVVVRSKSMGNSVKIVFYNV